MWEPLAQSMNEQLSGELGQLEGFKQPGLGRHAAKRLNIQLVIRTFFRVHRLLRSPYYIVPIRRPTDDTHTRVPYEELETVMGGSIAVVVHRGKLLNLSPSSIPIALPI